MQNLINHNIYEFSDNLIICGSCLPQMNPEAFKKLQENSENIYSVCLEEIHINMIAHKIASILRVGKIKNLIFASVDNSPHCVQLHYVRNELEKIMDLKNINIQNFIANKDNLIEIRPETISLSKNLSKLQNL